MKRISIYLLIGIALAGCSSSDTPQPSAELSKQFSGGPMPADAQKKFQESMKKSQDQAQQHAPNGGKQ